MDEIWEGGMHMDERERTEKFGENTEKQPDRDREEKTAEKAEEKREIEIGTAKDRENGRKRENVKAGRNPSEEKESDAVLWEDREREKDAKRRERGTVKKMTRGGNRKRRLTGSLAAKIVAFFLLAISCLTGMGSLFFSVYMGAQGFYTESRNYVLLDALGGVSATAMHEVTHRIERGDVKLAEAFCRDRNIDFELIRTEDDYEEYDEYRDYGGRVLWSTWDGNDTGLIRVWYVSFETDMASEPVVLSHYTLESDKIYLLRGYIDPDFPIEDDFKRVATLVSWLYDARYGFIVAAAVSIFLCLACFIFLLCSAGHHNDREEIVPGVLTGIPVDVLTVLLGAVILILVFGPFLMGGWPRDDEILAILMLFDGVALAVLMTFYFMDIALRVKLGIGLRHSLVYRILRQMGRAISFLGRGIRAMVRGLPMILTGVTAYLGLCILEFFIILVELSGRGELAGVLWLMEKAALFVAVAYVAFVCRKLLEGSRALADGRADCRVDTSRMIGIFKEYGDNLNSLGQGIAKAVSERMRSEHLKTELITNVSHDIKTPLTSIINYADLICEELGRSGDKTACQRVRGVELNCEEVGKGDSARTREESCEGAGTESRAEYAKIAEYAEVLLRQSRRLKKLLEDLVEASKATTGNLEVNLEPCEIGVLLSQAVGEYQQKMAEKELELIARQPESPVEIMADGRRLWRVFDNLLNNICKYAQENSRVNLSVEVREGNVLVIFRNMSKYPLDISVEELGERFVRGDKSRHMEGNGLGLSIARSLVELQNGKMEIVIDGDLFKVTLIFRVLSE